TETTDDETTAAGQPGRPTLYSEEIGTRICELLADGKTLTRICKDNPDFPSDRTVRRWALDKDHPFSPQYARAREIGYDAMADETIDTADMGGTDPGQVARDRLKVDTRKWLLSKALPKRYGDKLALHGDDEAPPIQQVTRIERVIVKPSSNQT
ncbi:MAG TPA: hypothetical protein VEB21_06675, partial [Terriglobales bacterium]|nr:hypothetical protein [Terriglobales bacterium]